MVSMLVHPFLLGLPSLGTAIALAAAFVSSRSAKSEEPSRKQPERTPNPMIVCAMLPIALVLFGFVLDFIYSGDSGEAIPVSILESGSMAYGVPSLLAGIGIGIVYIKSIGRVVQDQRLLSRMLVFAMHPLTVAIFGLFIAFLSLSRASDWTGGAQSFIEPAWRASIYMSIGGTAAPLSAMLSTSSDQAWRPEGFGRAVVRSTAAETICIIFLLLAFLAISP